MRKNVKKDSWPRIFGKAFIAAEFIGFVGCYFLWRKLNRDQVFRIVTYKQLYYFLSLQEFRLEAYKKYPPLVEMYYQIGETIDSNNQIREFDQMILRYKQIESEKIKKSL